MGSQNSEFCTLRITPVEAQHREISSITIVYARWSKPAPPSASGNATPVKPSSAAFLNSSRGKCPVSSSSLASGRTSDSANSRTLFCSSFCSSVSSRFTATPCHPVQGRGSASRNSSGQRLPQLLKRGLQFLRLHARFSRRGHKIRIPNPSRQNVQMQVPRHAGTGGLPQVHTQVHSVRRIIRAISRFHFLRQLHHFRQRLCIAEIQFRHMRVRHDHHVPGRVWIPVQDHECLFPPVNHQRLFIVGALHRSAEKTLGLLALRHFRHILEPPRRPNVIHRLQSSLAQSGIQHNPKFSSHPDLVFLKKNAPNLPGRPQPLIVRVHPHEGAASLGVASGLLTKSFNSLLGLKNGIFFAGTSTFSPVFGLRPTRPRRCRVRKLPNPRISILSPFCSASMMLSKIVSTIVSDSLRGSSVTRSTSSIKSAFVNVGCFVIVPASSIVCRLARTTPWCEAI